MANTTFPQQNFAAENIDRWDLPVADIADVIHQGDIVAWNSVLAAVVAATGAATGLQIIGVAEGSFPTTSGLDAAPVAAGNAQGKKVLAVRRTGMYYFFTTAGDNYNPFDVVYLGADAQTITEVATGSTAVGYVAPENFIVGNPQANFDGKLGGTFGPSPFPIAGAAGKRILVRFVAAFPSAIVGSNLA